MRTKAEILEQMNDPDEWFCKRTLEWVLTAPNCPLCDLPNRREIEVKLHRGEITPAFLETKYNWPVGSVNKHMEMHLEYSPTEAGHIEKMRDESISTLNVAENLVQRLVSWVDELEERKALEGLTSEWIADATKLLAQGQGFLKLVGQLKKEIGVDSQLLLADKKVDSMMGILVEVLKNEPVYLDQIQLQLATLQTPVVSYDDADFEVVE